LKTQKTFWRTSILAGIAAFVIFSTIGFLLWRHFSVEQQAILKAIFDKYFLFFLMIGLILFVAAGSALDWFFHFYIIPINRIVEQIKLIDTVDPTLRIRREGCHDVMRLVDTINNSTEEHARFRQSVEKQLHAARAESEAEKNILAALLEDLPQGILVCNIDGRIVLYNRKVRELLMPLKIDGNAPQGGASHLIGLGRSVFSLIDTNLIMRALDRIGQKLSLGQTAANERFLLETQTSALLPAEIIPVLDSQHHISAFILYVEDQIAKIQKEKELSTRLQSWQYQLTQHVSVIKSTAEILIAESLSTEERDHLVSLLAKEADLAAGLLTRRDITAKWSPNQPWPLTPVDTIEWVRFLAHRTNETIQLRLELETELQPVQISVDMHHLTGALLYVLHMIKQTADVSTIQGHLYLKESWVYLDMTWVGPALDNDGLLRWKESIPKIGSIELTIPLIDILRVHGARLWNIRGDHAPGSTGLRFLIPALETTQMDIIEGQPTVLPDSRPAFYDFDLFQHAIQSPEWDNRLLTDLVYTVFDTETTGLDPQGGDEIISIGAVRVVNGRLLRNEQFDQLVNPKRTLPWESVKFHGIRPEMLIDQPSIEQVLPGFHQFAKETVLVGHNVAFDMRMLQLKEVSAHIRFSNPILDTMLLSDIVHPAHRGHGLQAVADRLGVRIMGRHTALGDAMATAEIFLKLIPLLAAQGIRTMKEARLASQKSLYARLKY
jgi:DNA polymerase-3 subunit epsilon